MDSKIKLNNIQLYGYHGVSDMEKNTGQEFELDVEISPSCNTPISDNIENTIDYSILHKEVVKIFTESKYNLIEYLAKRIVDELTKKFKVSFCKVVIRKPNAPISCLNNPLRS